MSSKQVDDRVVEMRFDNAQFESAVKQSMNTLDNLNSNIKKNASGNATTINSLNKAINNIDTQGIAKGVDVVTAKFSGLNVAAMTVISNLTNSVVNFSKNMARSLTVQPLIDGLHEYETQMNSIQTIMSNTRSKGTTLDQVNSALDELNHYADLTIYNFTEMTKNIGTFTAAGVDLKTSVDSIKGIANLAAISGSTSQQASVAMYQLSQAIATGTVRLQDWNSVVNAGMGGEVFQKALERTAQHFGTDMDAILKKYGSFRESLTKGDWLTTKVLTETLKQISGAYKESDLIAQGYSKDQAKAIVDLANDATSAATEIKTFTQLASTIGEAIGSGWTKSWQIIVGDFEDAKSFWTTLWNGTISPIIDAVSNDRNNFLQEGLGSSWEQIGEQITSAGIPLSDFENKVKEVAKANGVHIDELIKKQGSLQKVMDSGAVSGDIVVKAIKELGNTAVKSSSQTEDLNAKLKYFQDVVDKVWHGDYMNGADRVKALTAAGYDYNKVQSLVNKTVDGHRLTLADLGEEQLKAIGYTEDQIKKLKELGAQAEKTGTPLNELIDNLSRPTGRELLIQSVYNSIKAIQKPLDAINGAFRETFQVNGSILYNFVEGLEKLTKSLILSDDDASKLKTTFDGLFDILKFVGDFASGALSEAFSELHDAFGTIFSDLNIDILGSTASLSEFISQTLSAVDAGQLGRDMVHGIGDTIRSLIEYLSQAINYISQIPIVNSILNEISDRFTSIVDYAKTFSGLNFGESIVKIFKDLAEAIKQVDWNSVKDQTVSFAKEAGEALSDFGKLALDALKTIFENLKSYASEFDGLSFTDGVKKLLGDIRSGLASGASDLGGWAYDQMTTVGPNIIQGLHDGLVSTPIDVIGLLTELAQNIVSSFKAVLGIHSPSTVFFEIGKNIIEGLINGLKSNSSAVLEFLQDLASKAANSMSGVDWGAVSILGFAASMAVAAYNLSKASRNISTTIKSFGLGWVGLGKDVSNFLGALTKRIKGNAFTPYADGILKIAGAIAVLVGAIILLSKQDMDKAWQATGMIGAIAGILLGVVTTLSLVAKKCGSIDIGAVTGVVIGFAAAALILSFAVKNLAGVDQGTIDVAVNLFSRFALCVLALVAIGGYAGQVNKAGAVALEFGVACLFMSTAVKILGSMDPGVVEQGTHTIEAFAACIAAMVLVGGYAGKTNKAGAVALEFSIACLLISLAIKSLGNIDEGVLAQGMAVIVFFGLVVAGLSAVAAIGGKSIKSVGVLALALAASALLLSYALDALGSIDPSKLSQAMKVVAGFGLIIAALILVSTFDKGGVDTAKNTIISVAAAMILMAEACKIMGNMSPDQMRRGLLAVVAFAAICLAIMKLGTLIGGGQVPKMAATIFAMAVMFAVMAAATYLLGSMNEENLRKGLRCITILGLLMTVMMKAASEVKPGVTGTFVAIAVSLGILVAGLAILSFIEPDRLMASVMAIATLMALLAVVFRQAANVHADPVAMFAITASLAVLVAGLAILSRFDPSNVIASALAMAAVMAVFVLVLKQVANMKDMTSDAVPTIIALGIVFAALGAVVALMASQDLASVVVSALMLAAVMAVFTAILEKLSGYEGLSNRALVSIAILGLVFYSLGEALAYIAANDWTSVVAAGLALSAVMVVFTGVLETLSNSSGLSNRALASVAVMTFVVKSLGDTLSQLASFDPANSLASAISLSMLLIVMTGCLEALSNMSGVSATALAALTVIGLIMAGMGAVVGLMEQYDIAPSLESATAMSELIITMTGVLAALSAIGPAAEAAIPAAGAMAAVIGIMGGVVAAAGALAQIPGLEWLVGEGGDLLQKVGEAIGKFIGGIGGGIAAGFTDSLPEVAQNLSDFAMKLLPFMVTMQMFTPDMANSAKSLIDVVTGLTANNLMSQLGSLFGGETDFDKIADQLVKFGSCIAQYAQSVSGVDFSGVEQSATAGKALTELANSMPKEGGLAQSIFGTNVDMGTFGMQLAMFGASLQMYSLSLNGVNFDAISRSSEVGKALSDLANSLPKEGGLAQAIFGETTDFKTFGTQLASFGKAISAYSVSVAKLDTDGINKSVTAGQALQQLASSLPKDGGLAQAIFGGTDMAAFGSQLTAFGEALYDYAGAVYGLDADGVVKSANAAKAVVTVLKNIPTDGSIGTGMTSLQSAFTSLASALAAYSNGLSGVNLDSIGSATSKLSTLVSTISSLNGADFSGISKLSSLTQVGQYLSDMSNSLSGVNIGAINNAASAISKITSAVNGITSINLGGIQQLKTAVDQLSTIKFDKIISNFANASKLNGSGANIMKGLASGISNGSNQVMTALNNIMNRMAQTVTKGANTMRTAGSTLSRNLASGIATGASVVNASIRSCLANAASTIRSYYGQFVSSGRYVASGLAAGISSGTSSVVAAAHAMAAAAASAARAALSIHSPSRVMYKIGNYTYQGFANALRDNYKNSYRRGYTVADQAAAGFGAAIAQISAYADDVADSDINPVITPIVDLSDVDSSASMIDNLLGGVIDSGSLSRFNSISSAINTMNRTDQNADIISALKQLQKSVDAMPNTGSIVIGDISYDGNSAVASAVTALTNAIRVERRS